MAENSTNFDFKALLKNEKFMKCVDVAKTVLFWLVIAFAVFMMVFTIVSVNMFDQQDRTLFGYRMLIVKSDSMKKTHFDAGDLIFVKEVKDLNDIKEGDVISFISQGKENYGEVVTHKVKEKTTDGEGGIAFVTYGTTSGDEDDALATVVLGVYTGKLPKMGYFFNFMQTTPGYIVCILVPFLILILWQGANSVILFIKYRKEQNAEMEARSAEMEAERQKIAEEKAETQRMMEEILKLKAQLAQQNIIPADDTTSQNSTDETK